VTASLLAHARYQPDLSALACDRVRLARQAAGSSPAVFAMQISDMVGWDLDPDLIGPWESGRGTPPGDVVLAAFLLCADVTSPAPPKRRSSRRPGTQRTTNPQRGQ
jgi:hypothetical protein